MIKKIGFAALVFLFSQLALAKSQPVNFSLIPDVAVFNKSTHITGFILNIWGENPQKAFALGIVNGSTGDSSGLSLALAANYSENYLGAQIGLVNYASKHMQGLQWGAVNYAKHLTGLQLGLVNYSEKVDSGLQIGIVNVIRNTKTWFKEFPGTLAPFFILANWRFE